MRCPLPKIGLRGSAPSKSCLSVIMMGCQVRRFDLRLFRIQGVSVKMSTSHQRRGCGRNAGAFQSRRLRKNVTLSRPPVFRIGGTTDLCTKPETYPSVQRRQHGPGGSSGIKIFLCRSLNPTCMTPFYNRYTSICIWALPSESTAGFQHLPTHLSRHAPNS